MKKLIVITLAVLFTSTACSTLKDIDGYENMTGVDFRPYTEKGFLITPSTYGGEYTSLYWVDYVIMPEAYYEVEWVIGTINLETALDGVYKKCISMGADALMEFDIENNIDSYTGIVNPTSVTGVRISGVAIKRED